MKKFIREITGWFSVALIGAGIIGTGTFIIGTFFGLPKIAVLGFITAVGALCSAGACKDVFLEELQSIADGEDGDEA